MSADTIKTIDALARMMPGPYPMVQATYPPGADCRYLTDKERTAAASFPAWWATLDPANKARLAAAVDAEAGRGNDEDTVEPFVRQALGHLRGLVDILGPCDHFDHHGYCQTHFIESPCRVGKAREFLDSLPNDNAHSSRVSAAKEG